MYPDDFDLLTLDDCIWMCGLFEGCKFVVYDEVLEVFEEEAKG